MLNTEVSFYTNLSARTLKNIRLLDFLTSTEYKAAVEKMRGTQDKSRKDQLKKGLPAITPSGIFKGTRRADRLAKHSGLICIDVDAKDNTDLADFAKLKERVTDLDCVAYCGLSASGKGFFIIIPIACPEKHKEHFEALKIDFAACGLTVDPSCGDVSRLRFASYDDRPYINHHAKPYSRIVERKPKHRISPSTDVDHRVIALIEMIELCEKDITEVYRDWFDLACAFANTYDEAGRELFHRVSVFYPGYEVDNTDVEYDKALKGDYSAVTISTLFHRAKEHCIILNNPAADDYD